jgi:hypothetical protein
LNKCPGAPIPGLSPSSLKFVWRPRIWPSRRLHLLIACRPPQASMGLEFIASRLYCLSCPVFTCLRLPAHQLRACLFPRMHTHAAHPIPPCALSLVSARLDSPPKIHCHHPHARYSPPTPLLSANHTLAIRHPHVRYLLPTSSLPATPLVPTISAPYALNGRRPCARYPLPTHLIPAPCALVPNHPDLNPRCPSLAWDLDTRCCPPLPCSIPAPCTLIARRSPLDPRPMHARPPLPAHQLPAAHAQPFPQLCSNCVIFFSSSLLLFHEKT